MTNTLQTFVTADQIADQVMDELTKIGWVFLRDANKTVPYDTWQLRDTGDVTTDKNGGSVYVSYDTPYAVRQHEEFPNKRKPGRRMRWLTLTGQEKSATYFNLLARQCRNNIK